MKIHVIQEGDSVSAIARSYGVSEERIILDNRIGHPGRLAVGDALVILEPAQIYTVKEGDTLGDIAYSYGVSVMELLRNNPYLIDKDYIYPGESIVISYQDKKRASISVIGYAYPHINRTVLMQTLPFLTYLAIYRYVVTEDGGLLDIDDTEMIRMAREYGVAPLMLVSAFVPKGTKLTNVAHKILNSTTLQDHIMNQLLTNLKNKGYYGVIIDTPYIYPEDRELYAKRIDAFTKYLNKEGFVVFNSMGADIFEIINRIRYPMMRYGEIGSKINGVILLSYELGQMASTPASSICNDMLNTLLEEVVSIIRADRTYLGMTNIGYIWRMPYEDGATKGSALSHNQILRLSVENKQPILYDEHSHTAYLWHHSAEEHYVRFKDVRSVNAYLNTIEEFGLKGIAYWNIMEFFPAVWQVVNSRFEIEKIPLNITSSHHQC